MQVSSSHREIDWSAVLADFRRSGMTHVQFCSARGLSIHVFRRQLYRLRPGLPPRRPHTPRPATPTAATSDARPAFLPVHIRPDDSDRSPFVAAPSPPFEIVLPGHRVLRVPAGFDADSLGRLLDFLEDRP